MPISDPIYQSAEPTFRITTASKKKIIIERLEDEPFRPTSISELAVEYACDSPGVPLDELMLGLD